MTESRVANLESSDAGKRPEMCAPVKRQNLCLILVAEGGIFVHGSRYRCASGFRPLDHIGITLRRSIGDLQINGGLLLVVDRFAAVVIAVDDDTPQPQVVDR